LLAPTVQGTVALVVVQRALQMRSTELSACIAGLPATARGKVVVEAVVDLTGDIWRAKATESSVGAGETACLLGVIRDIAFGGPLAAPATVTLPIEIGAHTP
jgi:hypothetical protein